LLRVCRLVAFYEQMDGFLQNLCQPPSQWVTEYLSVGVKWPGREVNHPPLRGQKCVELYLHSPNTPSCVAQLTKAQGQIYLYLLCIM